MIKTRYIGILLLIINHLSLNAQTVSINEIMSSNTISITDEDGDFEDWIELYNWGNEAVSISGWTITDDISNPDKWVFPEFSINPHNFILVFASGKDRQHSTYFHSNFKISASGEALYLFDENGNMVDSFPAVKIESDKSFGRFPDGSLTQVHFFQYSPWNSNNQSNVLNQISSSHKSGTYSEAISLSLNSDGGDSIYYSFHGFDPHPDSSRTQLFHENLLISSPIGEADLFTGIRTSPEQNVLYPWIKPQTKFSKARIVRARSFRNQMPSSDISSFTFFVSEEMNKAYSFPVVSIILDSSHLFAWDTGIYVPGKHYRPVDEKTGNYFKTGKSWERRGYVEIFSTSSESLTSQECGIRVHGNLSREFPQKSLRLYARKEYGSELFIHNIFPDAPLNDYHRLVFRTPLTSHEFTMFKDPLIHQLIEGLNVKTVAFSPVIIFVNGEYWGIQNMRERVDEFFYEMHYNIDVNHLDQLSGIGDISNGDSLDYITLMEFVENNSLADDDNYQYLCSHIDIDNYIDYYIIETYFANLDWPGNNYEYWRSPDLDYKWRWQILDLDATFGEYTFNMFEHISETNGDSLLNPPWSTLLFRRLIENPAFVEQFVTRYEYVVQNYFNTDRLISAIDEFEDLYENELPEHIKRWNLPGNINMFYTNVEWMRKFAIKRPCVVRDQLLDFFNIEKLNISCFSDQLIDSTSKLSIINIFPNPAVNEVYISVYSQMETNLNINILNQMGQSVYSQSSEIQKGKNLLNPYLFFLSDAYYILELSTSEAVCRKKLVILK